jgi:acyl carrier protein phosphodiesterase
MNFLAHLYLSGESPQIKTGNFIGDFVKGKNLTDRFEPEIAKGIALHREIDWFTDRHLVVKQSKDRLREKYRHYSGVIVDIFYDHFLAKHWDRYSAQVLPDFADDCYALLQKQSGTLPEEVNFLLPYMIKGNWLVNYSRLEGIQKALSGMARRTRFESKMEQSVADLENHYEDFHKEFELFFPELVEFCERWIKSS